MKHTLRKIFYYSSGAALLLFAGAHMLGAQVILNSTLSSDTDMLTTTTTTSGSDSLSSTTNSTGGTISSVTTYVDIIPPVIKVMGNTTLYVSAGSPYIDPGAQAYDNVDGDISTHISLESNVNTGTSGTYHVVYRVKDRAGNEAQAERTVYVVASSQTSTSIQEPAQNNFTNTTGNTSPSAPTQNTTTGVSKDTDLNQTDNLIRTIQGNDLQQIKAAKERIIRDATQNKKEAEKKSADQTTASTLQENLTTQESPEEVQQKVQKVVERAQTSIDETRLDSDRDGISDYDEKYIYGTDPNNPDTDGDGYSDGSEILGGFDPNNPDLHGTIAYENPKTGGTEVKKDILAASMISVVPPKQETNTPAAAPKIEFKGKGLPHSFVTLYIFSVPMVITVRTDADGNWEYTLDKELTDGSHELYVAMTDNAGKILAKSSPIPFVKEANAITVDQTLLAPLSRGQSPSLLASGYLYATITVIISIIGVILTIIGMRSQPYPRQYVEQLKRENDLSDGNHG